MKWVMHVDMDAFFASCEQAINPKLKGKPIGVMADPYGRGKKRSVIAAASYEAKRMGVKAGMPPKDAFNLCPDLLLVQAHPSFYGYVHQTMLKLAKHISSEVENYSIDEFFMTYYGNDPDKLGQTIRAYVKKQFGITCSVGIAPGKLLAKMATEEGKPDGLTWWQPQFIPGVYKYLPVSAIPGIGPRREALLNKNGIYTLEDLALTPKSVIKNLMGILGEYYQKIAQGIDETPLITQEPPLKSITRSVTLDASTLSPLVVEAVGRLLCDSLSKGLEEIDSRAKELFIFLRYDDMTADSVGMKLELYTNNPDTIFQNFKLLNKKLRPYQQGIRLVGVGMTDIRQHYTPSLFCKDDPNPLKTTLEHIRQRYGYDSIIPANLLFAEPYTTLIAE
ncbi:DNA polymerase Y family protein [Coprothermobacter platensis]|uniref:DNA polymerase Y family protein n=1 Tax=Coprothermobacter platensis TaxID=108819 RepID=UPI0003621AFE|nr:DNA polymerase IV [Coprothermobacter platensis]